MSPSRRRVIQVVKSMIAVAIVVAVAYQFWKIFQDPEIGHYTPTIRVPQLLLAGLCYLAAHTIWGTFFVQLIWNEKAVVPWHVGIGAYFLSLVGKYVPGKALVIILRVVILKRHNVSRAAVAMAATYETLTTMAAGALLSVGLLPWTGVSKEIETEFGWYFWAGLAAMAALPLLLGLSNAGVARILRNMRGPEARALPSPSLLLLTRGLLQAMAGWCLLGLSLWLTISGLVAEPVELTGERFLQATATVAVAYVAGFLAFIIPGGIGPREWILLKMLPYLLPTGIGPVVGVVAIVTLVLRLIWTICEVVACLGILLVRLVRPGRVEQLPGPQPSPEPDRGLEWATDQPPNRI